MYIEQYTVPLHKRQPWQTRFLWGYSAYSNHVWDTVGSLRLVLIRVCRKLSQVYHKLLLSCIVTSCCECNPSCCLCTVSQATESVSNDAASVSQAVTSESQAAASVSQAATSVSQAIASCRKCITGCHKWITCCHKCITSCHKCITSYCKLPQVYHFLRFLTLKACTSTYIYSTLFTINVYSSNRRQCFSKFKDF